MTLAGVAEARQPWFWASADVVAATLLFLNLVLLVAVHARRLRQHVRTRRAREFSTRLDAVLDQLDPTARARSPQWLRAQISGFDELERPLAAIALIERMKPATAQERRHTLGVLREVGAVDNLLRSTARRMPWRRALAIRTLGWIGADEAISTLITRLGDRNRYVRESALRALGRIGDARAIPALAELFHSPGRVGPGVVYDALVSFGSEVETVFVDALQSEHVSVRVAASFGIAAVSAPENARRALDLLLKDQVPDVRSAAAESLGLVGGERLPKALGDATTDTHAAVRRAATTAVGSFDDRLSADLAANRLLDPDRDTAVRAGESLVRLSRRRLAGGAARRALRRFETEWPVERAQTFASLGVV